MKNEQYSSLSAHKYDGNYCTDYQYSGLAIHAGRGIHERVAQYIADNFPMSSKVLVLGAGTGSFDARLTALGFDDITSIDINQDNYAFKGNSKFVAADLNGEFQSRLDCKFDLIIAIEIIEHLNSTSSFLVSCKDLLAHSGAILVTSPNPRSHASRLKFLITGYHNGFEGIPTLYEHINPLHIDIFRHHCVFSGLQITRLESFDHLYDSKWHRVFLRKFFSVLLYILDSLYSPSLIHERGTILFLEVRHIKQN